MPGLCSLYITFRQLWIIDAVRLISTNIVSRYPMNVPGNADRNFDRPSVTEALRMISLHKE